MSQKKKLEEQKARLRLVLPPPRENLLNIMSVMPNTNHKDIQMENSPPNPHALLHGILMAIGCRPRSPNRPW